MTKTSRHKKKHYTLQQKIEALDLIDQLDENVAAAAKKLRISQATLYNWREDEPLLRQEFAERLRRQRSRLAAALQLKMLKRGERLLNHMTENTLENAPLNQQANALRALISQALKLDDLTRETHDEHQSDQTHTFPGWLRIAPPGARDRDAEQRQIQSRRLWAQVGEDRTGQIDHPGERCRERQTRLVARPHAPDGEPGLA